MATSLYQQYKSLCREHGVSRDNFRNRVKKGWSPIKAAITPVKRNTVREEDLEV